MAWISSGASVTESQKSCSFLMPPASSTAREKTAMPLAAPDRPSIASAVISRNSGDDVIDQRQLGGSSAYIILRYLLMTMMDGRLLLVSQPRQLPLGKPE